MLLSFSGLLSFRKPALLAAFPALVFRVRDFKFDQFYNPGLVTDLPGNDLPGAFVVFRFYNGPAAVHAILTAPLEEMQVSRSVDILDH